LFTTSSNIGRRTRTGPTSMIKYGKKLNPALMYLLVFVYGILQLSDLWLFVCRFLFVFAARCAVTFSWWGGLRTSLTRIAMLTGVFILLVGPRKSDRLKD